MTHFKPDNDLSEDLTEVKMAVDSLCLQYYEYIIQPWLATW